jgi:hypothetical protein
LEPELPKENACVIFKLATLLHPTLRAQSPEPLSPILKWYDPIDSLPIPPTKRITSDSVKSLPSSNPVFAQIECAAEAELSAIADAQLTSLLSTPFVTPTSLNSNGQRQIVATINLGDESSSNESCFNKPTNSYLILLVDAVNISVYCILYNMLGDGNFGGYYSLQRSMRKWFLKHVQDQLDESYDGVMAFCWDLREFMEDNKDHIIGCKGFFPGLLDAVRAQDRMFFLK